MIILNFLQAFSNVLYNTESKHCPKYGNSQFFYPHCSRNRCKGKLPWNCTEECVWLCTDVTQNSEICKKEHIFFYNLCTYVFEPFYTAYVFLDRHHVWQSHDPTSVQTFDFCEKKDLSPLFSFCLKRRNFWFFASIS